MLANINFHVTLKKKTCISLIMRIDTLSTSECTFLPFLQARRISGQLHGIALYTRLPLESPSHADCSVNAKFTVLKRSAQSCTLQ